MSCELNSEVGRVLSVAWGYHGTAAPAPGLSLVRVWGVMSTLVSTKWQIFPSVLRPLSNALGLVVELASP